MAFPALHTRQKRKEVDEISDDFSDFSISAPAMKMRRLDSDVPLIIPQSGTTFDCAMASTFLENVDFIQEQSSATATPVPISTKDDMAIILYKPPVINEVPSGLSFVVHPSVLASLKNKDHSFWSDPSTVKEEEEEEEESSYANKTAAAASTSLAVVPWQPSQICKADGASGSQLMENVMDLGEDEDMLMDVEEERVQGAGVQAPAAFVGMEPFGGLQQWQQQHCLHHNAPTNASTPITWSW